MRIRQTTWRLAAALQTQRTPIVERGSRGDATLGYAVGGLLVTYPKGFVANQQWHMHLLGGAGLVEQNYTKKAEDWREFEPGSSKMEAGLTTTFLQPWLQPKQKNRPSDFRPLPLPGIPQH